MTRFILSAFCLLFSFSLATAQEETQDRATRDEARTMAEAAAEHLRQVGPEQAFRDFEDKDGKFIDRDLYVFVQDYECTFFAHGLNPSLKGRNIWDLRNPNGRYACQDIVNITKADGAGWTRYIFQDPLSGGMAWKTTYSIGVGDYIVMVGAYSGPAGETDVTVDDQ